MFTAGNKNREAQGLKAIAIMVTDRCNLQCYHCFRFNQELKGDLDIGKIYRLIQVIKPGAVEKVRLTGGEPFLVRGLENLIESLSNADIYTSIVTNGTLLNLSILKKLRNSRLSALWFSVHSLKDEIHDCLSGGKGSCELLKKALKESIDVGIETNVYYPVSTQNEKDIEATLSWLDYVGVKRIKILKLVPLGKAQHSKRIKHFTTEEWCNLWERVQKKSKRTCAALEIQGLNTKENKEINKQTGVCTVLPLKHINIDPLGNLYPCCILNGKTDFCIGRLDELLEEEWHSMLDQLRNRTIKKYRQFGKGIIPCLEPHASLFETFNRCCPLFAQPILK